MIRNTSLRGGPAATVYTGCKSAKLKLSPHIFSIIFLAVFVGLAADVGEARQHVTVAGGGSHGLGIRVDGMVVAWGNDIYGQCKIPAGLGGVVEVAAGSSHSLALKSDGTVSAWGYNPSGQCNVPGDLSGVVAVAAGGAYSVALKSDGTVRAWGYDYYGESTVPAASMG